MAWPGAQSYLFIRGMLFSGGARGRGFSGEVYKFRDGVDIVWVRRGSSESRAKGEESAKPLLNASGIFSYSGISLC
jgi:hypothetical protein